MKKPIHTSGSRKKAVARATIKEGTGKIMINKFDISNYEPELYKMRIMEPLLLAGDTSKLNVSVNVKGGGFSSQADAARLAIARALALYNPKLEKVFILTNITFSQDSIYTF